MDKNNPVNRELSIFTDGPVVVFKWKAAKGWPVEYVSANVTNQFGYQPEDFTSGKIIYDSIIHPDDLPAVVEGVAACINSGKTYFQQEYRIARADGQYRWILEYSVIVRDPDGKPAHHYGYTLDVNGRKMAEDAVKDSEEILRGTLESTADGILVVDSDRKVLVSNSRFGQMWSIPQDVLATANDKTLLEFVSDQIEDPEAFKTTVEQLYASSTASFVDELNLKCGRVFERHSCPLVRKGREVGWVWNFRDITGRKKTEEAVRRQANEWQWLMKSMASPFAIFESVFDGNRRLIDVRFEYFNDAYSRLSGLELDKVRGKAASEVWSGIEEEWFEILGNVAVTGNSRDFEAFFSPTKTFFACRAYRPWDSPERFCVVYEDITERKKSEEELKQYNRMLRMLSVCNQALVRVTEEQILLEEICRLIGEIGGYPLAWVGYAQQDEARTVRVAARWGSNTEYLDKIHVTWADNELGSGPVGTAIRSDRVCIVRDIKSDPFFGPWRKEALARGYASCIAIPLHGQGRVIGTLSIYTSKSDAFHEKEVMLLTELAGDLEYGITSLRTRVELTETMEALKKSESQLKTIFRASPAGIAMATGRVISFLNDRLAAITGYTASELLGKSTRILYLSDQDFENAGQSLYEQVRKNGIGVIETKFNRKNGEVIDVILTASALEAADTYNIVFSILDVTSRKQLEREREQLIHSLAAKNEELESIIYVGSHDLRSPQVNVQGFGMELMRSCAELKELIKSNQIVPETAKQINQIIDTDLPTSVEFISAGIKKMGSILDGLLEISRLGRIEIRFEPVEMNVIIKTILESLAYKIKRKNIVVEIGSLPNCTADRVQINDVFFNLIDNAAVFLDPSRPGIIRISGRQKDGTVIYCVEDNGIGISQSYFRDIFEPFHQLEPSRSGGPGLGLTVVKRIINRLNGKIWVESRQGEWSRFYVELPKAT